MRSFGPYPTVYPDGRVCISILHPPGEDKFNEQVMIVVEREKPKNEEPFVLESVLLSLAVYPWCCGSRICSGRFSELMSFLCHMILHVLGWRPIFPSLTVSRCPGR